jgi:radical SAM protein with 4Fe4S-binding SPASM domain
MESRSGLYVSLSERFSLKGSGKERYLLDLRDRSKFELDKEQYALLAECDGQRTLAKILAGYEKGSRRLARVFLRKLDSMGAISYAEEGGRRREFSALARAPQLQAVHFEITGECNMRCRHCYQEKYLGQAADLSLIELDGLAKEMRRLNVEKMGVSGGEPFARLDLFEAIGLFEAQEISISSILTNGTLLSSSTIERITRLTSRPTIFISLDGLGAASMRLRGYLYSSGQERFETVLRNIAATVSSGLPVMINTVVTNDNVGQLKTMYRRLRAMGVTGWRIALPKRIGSFLKNEKSFGIDRQRAFEAYAEIIGLHLDPSGGRDSRFKLQIEHFFRLEVFDGLKLLDSRAHVCDYEGKLQSCCIKPNGDVTPCPLFLSEVVGNVRESSLGDIWYSPEMRELKGIRICDVPACRRCELKGLCATGCRANAVFLHGSKTSLDDDACAATGFFLKEVVPLLKRKGIRLPEIF